jgi:hypothetical protein
MSIGEIASTGVILIEGHVALIRGQAGQTANDAGKSPLITYKTSI